MCRDYKHGLAATGADSCCIAALLRWWTLSGSLMTIYWGFTTAPTKNAQNDHCHTLLEMTVLVHLAARLHQHNLLTKWLDFWIARRLISCSHVGYC